MYKDTNSYFLTAFSRFMANPSMVKLLPEKALHSHIQKYYSSKTFFATVVLEPDVFFSYVWMYQT